MLMYVGHHYRYSINSLFRTVQTFLRVWYNFLPLIKQDTTALGYAANHGHLDVVKYLIEKGADMDKADYLVGNWLNQ